MATSAQIRQQLVEALQLDLIGPGWDDVARRQERLPQPPSIWYTTGFLVPNTFQEEAVQEAWRGNNSECWMFSQDMESISLIPTARSTQPSGAAQPSRSR